MLKVLIKHIPNAVIAAEQAIGQLNADSPAAELTQLPTQALIMGGHTRGVISNAPHILHAPEDETDTRI